jgi:hypothetical protein
MNTVSGCLACARGHHVRPLCVAHIAMQCALVLPRASRPRLIWLGHGLATARLRSCCGWPPRLPLVACRPAASRCALTAVAVALPICCPTPCCTAAMLLRSLPRAVARPLPLLLASPRTWQCPYCRRHHLAIYGTAVAHVVPDRGRAHVLSSRDGL